MKKFVMYLVTIVFALAIFTPAYAATSTYTYILDNASLFDDSTDMLSMAKEIRSKLDFSIHIYSVESIDDSEEIISQHIQDSTALLIFISEDGEMTWYSGSIVKHTIRDVDFENLFSNIRTSNKHYTSDVNFILSKIISIYIDQTETIDNYVVDYKNETSTQSWLVMNFNYCINFIKTHPVRILFVIIILSAALIYYNRRSNREE